MTTLKIREVKGRRYLYLSHSFTYRGRRRRFEKVVGRADAPPEVLKRREMFFRGYLNLKGVLYRVYLDTIMDRMRYIPQDYAFFLSLVKHTYQNYIKDLYPEEIEKYISQFNIRYVHNTTAIEGNPLTLRETAIILKDGIAPPGATLRQIHEIDNYRNLLRYVESYRGGLDLKFILKMHQLIERNIDDEHAGSFRRIEVGIEGSEWEPPPAIVVREEMERLLSWYRIEREKLHPVELAGIFHHRFLQIHPFIDGNGRVARELLNFILKRSGYPPIIIDVKEREEYMRYLEEADRGSVRGLLEYFSSLLVREYLQVILKYLKAAEPREVDLTGEEVLELKRVILWFLGLILPLNIKIPEFLAKKVEGVKELLPEV